MPVEAGLSGQFEYTVSDEMAAGHLGVKVLSTPSMIALMEISCHKTVEPYLERGQTTVGTYICVNHRAPAPVGAKVRVETELVEVDRRKLVFRVSVYWGEKLLGDGEHHRFVVNEEKFAAKLKEEFG